MIPKKQIFLFVVAGIASFFLLVFSSSIRQGWFAPADSYEVEFSSGDGLVEGTPVSMSGLKAGRVTSVELGENNHVLVKIRIQRKFAQRLHEDSKAMVGRPFIIGEKAISLTPGSSDKPKLDPAIRLQGEESLELTDLLSGGRLSPYFNTFSKLLDQLRVVIEGDGKNPDSNLVGLYKQAHKSLKSIDIMAYELQVIRKDFATTPEMKKVVKDVSHSTDKIDDLLSQMNTAMPALTTLSGDVAHLMPQVAKTLSETVFTLQALQKSFILRGAVSDLKEEQERHPASSLPATRVEDLRSGH